MKNGFLRITAAVLSAIMLTACKSDKIKNEPTPEQEDSALEHPFLELSYSDFKKVIVPVNHDTERLPDFECECIDFSELDYGAKLPPCKSPENRDNFVPEYYLYVKAKLESEEVEEDFREYYEDDLRRYEDSLTIPHEGWVQDSFYDGHAIYIAVTFDVECSVYDHEWSVFEYITESGELTEVYSYSDISDTGRRQLAEVSGGTLFFIENIGSDDTKLIARDIETGEEKVIYSTAKDIEIIKADGGNLIFNDCEAESLIVTEGKGIEIIQNYDADRNYISFPVEYNAETGECTELMSADFIRDNKVRNYSYYGLPARTENAADSRKIDLVTDNYRISTDYTNGEIVCSTENMAMLYIPSTGELHTYDLEKMEYYVTDFSINGIDPCRYFDGIMIMYSLYSPYDRAVYGYMPEIGMLMSLSPDEYVYGMLRTEGDDIYLSDRFRIYTITKNGENV